MVEAKKIAKFVSLLGFATTKVEAKRISRKTLPDNKFDVAE
jgi:hypothetical protein